VLPLFCLAIGLVYLYTKKKYGAGSVAVVSFTLALFRAALLALVVGLALSTSFKALAGRESPPHFHTADRLHLAETWVDNSAAFQFGFMREQVFGGYPSSHATIYFAFAFLMLYIYIYGKRQHAGGCTTLKVVHSSLLVASFLVALYIAIGVSLGHHWFSEVLAGAMLGLIIARSVYPYVVTVTLQKTF
jgi:membrane-associated phospholipid phosphatase